MDGLLAELFRVLEALDRAREQRCDHLNTEVVGVISFVLLHIAGLVKVSSCDDVLLEGLAYKFPFT